MLLFFKKEVLAFLALTPLAQATPTTQQAAQAQTIARRDLAGAQAQAARLADAGARQAEALRGIEARVLAAAASLADATSRQRAAEAALARARSDFAVLLPVMLRLSGMPAETILAIPLPPEQAIQGLLITQGLAIGLNRQAHLLQDAQAAAISTEAETARRTQALAAERAAQAARAAELDRVIAQARGQVTQAEAEGRAAAEQVAEAAAQARTLREAIAAMDAAQAKAVAQAARDAADAARHHQPVAAQAAHARQAALARPAGPALAQRAGQLVTPVAGAVLRAFGAPAEDGPATGITYAAAPGAYVSAPCAGRVAFAAPFRSYGQLLIVECGGGYDIVLAGLGSLAARPGHATRPGEPLGRMPDGGKASLYVELRSQGRPVDPAPFLKGKL